MLPTENTLMAQWTTMLLSIILPWQTLNSSDRMPQANQLQESESKLSACKTDQSTAQRWDQLRAHSLLLCTPHHISLTETPLTDGRTSTKLGSPNLSQTQFHSFAPPTATGSRWPILQNSSKTRSRCTIRADRSRTLVTTLSRRGTPCSQGSHKWWRKREQRRSRGRMAGIHTSSLSPNTTSRFTVPWRFHSREFDDQ